MVTFSIGTNLEVDSFVVSLVMRNSALFNAQEYLFWYCWISVQYSLVQACFFSVQLVCSYILDWIRSKSPFFIFLELLLTNCSYYFSRSSIFPMCLPVRSIFYLDGPKSVFLCSLVCLFWSVCQRVPTPKCSLMHHVFSVSVWLAQVCIVLVAKHHVYVSACRVNFLFGWAQICLTDVSFWSVCRRVPNPKCSLMHHVFSVSVWSAQVCTVLLVKHHV